LTIVSQGYNMAPQTIFLPVVAQVWLVIGLYALLARGKKQAAAKGEVDEARRALHADAWPDSVRQINNNIANQFELPVLFFVLLLALYSLGVAGHFAQALAWVFVGSRYLHAHEHVGRNLVPRRRALFSIGVIAVLGLSFCLLWAVIRHAT
jgi:hypothetical protein